MKASLNRASAPRAKVALSIELLVYIFTVCGLAIVTVVAVLYTGISPTPTDEVLTYITPDSLEYSGQWLAGILICVLLLAVFCVAWRFADRVRPSVLLAVSLSITTAIGIAWVGAHDVSYTVFPDARNLVSYAKGFVSGDVTCFAIDDGSGYRPEEVVAYFRHYPFQAGMLFYYIGMFRLFGAGNVMALRYANVLANEMALVCLYAILRRLTESIRMRNIAMLLLTLFLPFWLLSAFPYGNSVGFAFAVVYLACQVEALASTSWRTTMAWAGLSVVPLLLSLTIKSTFILVELAVLAVWFVKLVRGNGLAGLIISIAVFLIVRFATGLEVKALENMLGKPLGDGMPSTSWLVLGLSEDETFGQPGLWDTEAYRIYADANGEYANQSEQSRKRLIELANGLLSDWGYANAFFAKKLAFEWADPTFMSIYYSVLNLDSSGRLFGYDADGNVMHQRKREAFIVCYDGFQSAMYLFAIIGAIHTAYCLFRSKASMRRDTWLLLCFCFCAGFSCYFLWEAKGVYLLPFFVLLLPISACGIEVFANWAAHRLQKA